MNDLSENQVVKSEETFSTLSISSKQQNVKLLHNIKHTLMLFSFCDLALERDVHLVMEVTSSYDDNHLNHVGQHCSQFAGSDPADSFHARMKLCKYHNSVYNW